MTDEVLDRWTRRMKGVVACLLDEGVAEADVSATARAALLFVAGTEVQSFGAWILEQSGDPSSLDPEEMKRYLELKPYFHAAARLKGYVHIVWAEVADAGLSGEAIFEFLWDVLARVEGERLLASLEASP